MLKESLMSSKESRCSMRTLNMGHQPRELGQLDSFIYRYIKNEVRLGDLILLYSYSVIIIYSGQGRQKLYLTHHPPYSEQPLGFVVDPTHQHLIHQHP